MSTPVTFTTTPSTTTHNRKLTGSLRVPGDKSMSHRSIMLGSIAEGTTNVTGFLTGEDCIATMNAFRQMGVEIEGPSGEAGTEVTIHGVGMRGLKQPETTLDMGNSGTAMRLMTGLLAGQNFDSKLIGDESLSTRPMNRIIKPLQSMGVTIDTDEGGTAPLNIKGSQKLTAIHYDMPVASAQVKSAVLLAGLYADGETSVSEPGITRDHSERMLRGFGYEVTTIGNRMSLNGGGKLSASNIDIPADISSAAFFMVGASITAGSDLLLEHVGINPTRTGVIDILKLMGADITLSNKQEVGGEPVADIRIRSAKLTGIQIPEELVPLAIDEFPVLFVAAACATGETRLTGAEELRVKESDRIQVMVDGLVNCGIDAEATPDGLVIQGGQLTSGTVDSHGDHRISMAFSIAGLCTNGAITINDCTNVNTSFPGFVDLANSVGLGISSQ